MLERVPCLPARVLERDAYLSDYRREYERIDDAFWKLERGQTFREIGDASWEAFAGGDWDLSLELNEADRATAMEMAENDRKHGIRTNRIRVVELPVSPYVQWEMQFFRLLVEAGQELRVLDARELRDHERHQPLPELALLGSRVLYQVLYESDGTPCGARRIDDPGIIRACRAELAALFARGEPLMDFFSREIAPLPAPAQ
jgi:hypothetical protein